MVRIRKSPDFFIRIFTRMEMGTKIELRVTGDKHEGFFIEYKLGDGGEWTRFSTPYYTYYGAAASMMQLREQTRHGLNESLKVLFNIQDSKDNSQ